MRTYWCNDCEKCVDVDMEKSPECKCGKVFGTQGNISDYINMRTTWSGQTKMEFNTRTIGSSIEKMGGDLDR